MTALAGAAVDASFSPRESANRSPFAWQPFETKLLLRTDLSCEHSSQGCMAARGAACLMSHGSNEDSRAHSSTGPSSHGSIGAAEKGDFPEHSPSMARSGASLAEAAAKAHAGVCEEADATSMQLRPRLRGGASTRHRVADSAVAGGCAEAPELPPIEGSTARQKATTALRMADAAMADAREKAALAMRSVAAAQQAAARQARPAKRRRRQVLRAYAGPPSHVLLGARISVYWPDDRAFYKGRIVEVREDGEEARCVYDDEMEEWLVLARERFQWLAPRAQSAGGSLALQAEMARMGAVGVSEAPHVPDEAAAPLAGNVRAPLDAKAVGGTVAVHFAGVGSWCCGEVIAYDDAREMHHVLYEDGEHEWVALRKEAHRWAPSQPGPAYPAGLPPGVPAPAGRKALGWRVGVYLPESAAFAEGEVLGCCNLSGRHHLMYDSGEQEHVLLSCVKVRWVMPPSGSSHGQALRSSDSPADHVVQQRAPLPFGIATPDSARPVRQCKSTGPGQAAHSKRHLFAGTPVPTKRSPMQPMAWLKEEPLCPLAAPDAQLLGFDNDEAMHGLCEEFGEEEEQGPGQAYGSWWQAERPKGGTPGAHALFGAPDQQPWPPLLPSPGSPPQAAESEGGRASMHLEELASELDGAGEEADVAADMGATSLPMSAAMQHLEPLDLRLPSLPGLGADALKGLLLGDELQPEHAPAAGAAAAAAMAAAADLSSALATNTAIVLGSSEHGSNAAESLLQRTASAAEAADQKAALDVAAEADIAQFLCVADDSALDAAPEGQALHTQGAARTAVQPLSSLPSEEGAAATKAVFQEMGQSLALGGARHSIRSMASDSTAVDLSSRHSSICPIALRAAAAALPAAAAAATPQSGRALPAWEAKLPDLAPGEVNLDEGMAAGDGLVMSNELQTLLADMDWA